MGMGNVLVYDGLADLLSGLDGCGESGDGRTVGSWSLQETTISANDIVATILGGAVEFWKCTRILVMRSYPTSSQPAQARERKPTFASIHDRTVLQTRIRQTKHLGQPAHETLSARSRLPCDLPDHGIRHHVHELAGDKSGQSLIDQPLESQPALLLKCCIDMGSSADRLVARILRWRSQPGGNGIGIFDRLARLLGFEILRQLRCTVGPVFAQEAGEAG